MLFKKIVIGGLMLFIFLALLVVAGLWGFEKYMHTSLLLNQLDMKVNGPSSAFAYQEEQTRGSFKSVQEQLNDLTERQGRIERFLLLPVDRQGRRVLTTDDVGYYLSSLIGMGDWQAMWNDDPSPSRGTSTLWMRHAYELRIPYNPDWGNAAYAVVPYEVQGEDVLFGPVHVSEMTGAYRGAHFSTTEPQAINDVLTDPKNQTFPCGIEEEPLPPKLLKIGKHQVVRVVVDTCELGTVTYILPGKASNYLFTTNSDEEILKWTVERFEEKE